MMFARPMMRLCLALAPMFAAAPSGAQTFPSGPIRLVLPYAPGGVVDTVGRIVAQKLSEKLGQPVIADNKPGAGGLVGGASVAHAAPDGQTLLLMDPAIVINPSLQETVPFNLFQELTAVSMISTSPLVLVVNKDLPVKSFAELVAYGKAHPGELNFASAGIGTTPHLSGELWALRTGVKATHVPYRGTGASVVDLVAGKVQMAFNGIPSALPFTRDGQLRALATTGLKRPEAYPDTPTVEEAGLPDFHVDLWLALFAPAKTPAGTVAALNDALGIVLRDLETRKAMAAVGVEPNPTSSADANAFVRSESALWRKVIEDGHIKP